MIHKTSSAGRHRAFRETDVLGRAMHAFRRGGYATVSVRDLEAATGISVGSIYNAYGDKAGLFDAAFRHYNVVVLGGRIAEHAPPGAGLDGLRELFRSLMHEPDDGSFGCLLTNSAVELGAEPAPHPLVQAGFEQLRRTFVDRLQAARAAGLLAPAIEPETAGLLLVTLYQGFLVLVRAGYDKPSLEALVDAYFSTLEHTHA